MTYFWATLLLVNVAAYGLYPNGWSFVSGVMAFVALVINYPFISRS